MINSPTLFTDKPDTLILKGKLDLNSLRPESLYLCSDADFEIFRTAVIEVITEGVDIADTDTPKTYPSPLHEAIENIYVRYEIEEAITKNDLRKFLGHVAESTQYLRDNRLRKGLLRHTWNIQKHDMHTWIEFFADLCTPSSDTTPLPDLTHLQSDNKLERLNTLAEWVETLQKKARLDAAADHADESHHEIEFTKHPFKGILTATCAKIYEEDDFVRLTAREISAGLIELILEWDTANDTVNRTFAIEQRIAEARRLDEAAAPFVEDGEPVPENPYTVLIKTALTADAA